MNHNLQDLADKLDLPKKLDKKRDALLLAEIAAWLHMLGKFQESFLQGSDKECTTKIPSDITQNYSDLESLLTDSWTGNIWVKFNISKFGSHSLSLSHFIRLHQRKKLSQGLMQLMSDAHGRGSGIEKGILNRFASGQINIVYLSTAFGAETNAIDLGNLHNDRHCLYDFLQTNLKILKESLISSTIDWKIFRKEFISRIEGYFRQTVAETRRPFSDISLFDQTSASVAFFKAALAQNLLIGWQDPEDPETNKYHWRLLKIGLDSLTFWGGSVRIGDLLARKDLITKALNEVQKVIEEDYPLGLQVYRDENGSIFIVPDVDDLLNVTIGSENSLSGHFQEIANYHFKGEAYWTLELSNHTRNTLKFGRLANSQPKKLAANSKIIASHWNISEKRETCPVCGLRPIGSSDKALKLKICDICCDRHINRAKDWTENLPRTIWIDEVADANGRLALIVGSFNLESWLTGEAFNSIISFDPITRRMHNKKKANEEPKEFDFDYNQLVKDIENRVFTKDSNLENLIESLQTGGSFDEFYKTQVTDTDLGEDPNSEKKRPEDPFLLALAIMRQNPSFARLRRVWETTRKFWQEVIVEVPDLQLPKVKGRFTIKVRDSEIYRLNLANFGSYYLVFRNVKLCVLLWDGRLITTDNLCYVAKQLNTFSDSRENQKTNRYLDSERAASFIRSQLLNQQVSIEEPTGYGSPNRLRGQLEINNDNITLDSTEYSPVIQILAEPSTFIALVPANNLNSLESLNIVRTIKTKYEQEMGKVRNRLPLHLGVVYFDRRTPLRTALDAGRQMLSYKFANNKLWKVLKPRCLLDTEKQYPPNFEKPVTLTLSQEDSTITITWSVPMNMGDGTIDVWYPYVFLETHGDDSKVSKRHRKIKSQRPIKDQIPGEKDQIPGETALCWLVHVGDLIEGDQIYFTPSTFDFEYLDSSARRFEIYYDEKTGRRPRPTRPFYLEDLDRFHQLWTVLKNLQSSQRNQVIYTIEATREMWYGKEPEKSWTDSVFERFVTDTLANAEWPKHMQWQDIPERQQLVDAGVRGELTDLAELYMEILKER